MKLYNRSIGINVNVIYFYELYFQIISVKNVKAKSSTRKKWGKVNCMNEHMYWLLNIDLTHYAFKHFFCLFILCWFFSIYTYMNVLVLYVSLSLYLSVYIYIPLLSVNVNMSITIQPHSMRYYSLHFICLLILHFNY